MWLPKVLLTGADNALVVVVARLARVLVPTRVAVEVWVRDEVMLAHVPLCGDFMVLVWVQHGYFTIIRLEENWIFEVRPDVHGRLINFFLLSLLLLWFLCCFDRCLGCFSHFLRLDHGLLSILLWNNADRFQHSLRSLRVVDRRALRPLVSVEVVIRWPVLAN